MSRPNSSLQRNLTLTEELERLEQSITLTLQEIDHNFNRAHRIVTSSILPIVEQYAEQSRQVWEGSKFWKQFFESSANVSLRGYEDQPEGESGLNTTLTEDSTVETQTTALDEDEPYGTPSTEHLDFHNRDEDPDLSSLTLSPSHSTPRPSNHRKDDAQDITSSSIDYSSPYHETEAGASSTTFMSQVHDDLPTTPRRTPRHHHELETPLSSSSPPPTSHIKQSTAPGKDKLPNPVLHRVLDKTYRIQATPLATTTKTKNQFDDSPLSSPELEAPRLNAELFSPSVVKRGGRTPKPKRDRSPPKPGFSVLTPAKTRGQKPAAWDSDDDLDDDSADPTVFFGHSPPKTMRFHVPQSRLMKTPAKDASKRIVSELLQTAGGASDFTDEHDLNSPTIVRRSESFEDEFF
ncbi:hypothetical protein VTO42DRAFT_8439 [Malbranchea cinnamomea]